jgi:hypothetical protein
VECFFILFVGRIAVPHVSWDFLFSRTVTLSDGETFGFDVISDVVVLHNSGEVVLEIVTIVAGFPSVVERIPCNVVINEGGDVEHLAYPIVCHIYIGICVINEGTHLPHDVVPCFHVFPDVEGLDCHLSCVVFHVLIIHDFGGVSTDGVPPCQLVLSDGVAHHGDHAASCCHCGASDDTNGREDDETDDESNQQDVFHGVIPLTLIEYRKTDPFQPIVDTLPTVTPKVILTLAN